MILHIDKQAKTIRVSGITPIARELIRVGSERSAINHCIRMYKVDRDTAKWLAFAVRNGQEVDT